MTTPLYRNDKRATFPTSWYSATVDAPPLRPELRGRHDVDVCVVGAGYTGLTAARTLAGMGLSVIVLEAHRAGFGASGRNGGQVASGYNALQSLLAQKLGADTARALWDLAQEAKGDVAANCATIAPDAQRKPGIAHGCNDTAELEKMKAEAAFLAATYGYDDIEMYDTAPFREIVKTRRYTGGTIDRGGAHIHPLRYALALAQAAEDAGAVIYEKSAVHHLAKGDPATLRTSKGLVKAKHVVLATNGYTAGLERSVAARVQPVNSFICATAPLNGAAQVLAQDIAVEDSKTFVNYYRMSADNRLLFGGRASARVAFPKDIGALLRPRMLDLFPQLAETKIVYRWGGTLGVTLSALPAVQRIGPNIVSAGGFTGHGVALSGLCGKVMAEAIAGQAGRFDTLASIPAPAYPGGPFGARALLGLFMTWSTLRDRLGS